VAGLAVSTPAVAQSYTQHNLVSDLPGVAPTTDANLVNPWGIVFPPKGPFWISDNNAGPPFMTEMAIRFRSVPPS